MSLTIVTKYLPATDHHGSRVKATSFRGSATIPFDCAGDNYTAHRRAALALLVKRHPPVQVGDMVGHVLPDGNSHQYVFIIESKGV
jgi:hypothetical protein